jgi:hypothetical protein
MQTSELKPGEAARVRPSIHSPYSGRVGVIMNSDTSDERAPHLVMFSDGLQFRYQAAELEPLENNPQRTVFEAVLRVLGETRRSLSRHKTLT